MIERDRVFSSFPFLLSLQRAPLRLQRTGARALSVAIFASLLTACVTNEAPPAPPPAPKPAPVPVPQPPPPPPPPAPLPPLPIEMPVPSKDASSQVELPAYARKGRRLPPDGGEPGRIFVNYCKTFEIERDAASYFKRLQKNGQLPSPSVIAARSREAGQTLTQQQVVERDWAIQRDNAKSTPQRCKVLGGSVDAGVAVLVVEADIYGKRQRGTATLNNANDRWKVRDHGSWEAVR